MMGRAWFLITIFMIGAILCLDGCVLFALKKINFGSILPFVIGVFLCAYSYYYQKINLYLTRKPKLIRLWKMGWGVFFLWCMSLLFFFMYIHHHSKVDDEVEVVDAIIVLGAGIVDNQPSWALAERLDTAAEVFAKKNGAMIIVTGGLGFQQTLTEAEVMSAYLQKRHQIADESIALEDQSTSTELNLKNSQPILQRYGLNNDSAVVIVTSDFHTLRAAAIARKLGFKNIATVGAMTPIGIRYNAWLREYFAYISGWLLNEY